MRRLLDFGLDKIFAAVSFRVCLQMALNPGQRHILLINGSGALGLQTATGRTGLSGDRNRRTADGPSEPESTENSSRRGSLNERVGLLSLVDIEIHFSEKPTRSLFGWP